MHVCASIYECRNIHNIRLQYFVNPCFLYALLLMCAGSVVIYQPAQARVYINIMHLVYILICTHSYVYTHLHVTSLALEPWLGVWTSSTSDMCTYSLCSLTQK